MSDDRLLEALRRYGEQRPSARADKAARTLLAERWTAPRPRAGLRVPRFAPAALAAVLLFSATSNALGAAADSPLWEARLVLEQVGAFARLTPEARANYLADLVLSRTEEMARQEARGNALAAGKARTARDEGLRELGVQPEPVVPSPAPTPDVAVVPSLPPSPSPSPSPFPTVPPRTAVPTQAATATRPALTAAPTKPPTAPPTVKPTPTEPGAQSILVLGSVRFADGTSTNNVCIATSTAAGSPCVTHSQNGSWSFVATLKPGTSLTLVGTVTDSGRGGLHGGFASATVVQPMTQFPTIVLQLKPQ